MTMMPSKQRFRVKVTKRCEVDPCFQFWLVPQPPVKTVAELSQQLAEQVPDLLSHPPTFSVLLDGFALLPNTPVDAISDTDILQVVTNEAEVAGRAVHRNATPGHSLQPAVLSLPGPSAHHSEQHGQSSGAQLEATAVNLEAKDRQQEVKVNGTAAAVDNSARSAGKKDSKQAKKSTKGKGKECTADEQCKKKVKKLGKSSEKVAKTKAKKQRKKDKKHEEQLAAAVHETVEDHHHQQQQNLDEDELCGGAKAGEHLDPQDYLADDPPIREATGEDHKQGTDDAAQDAEASGSKKRSRSAQRKAMKRKHRRLGLLPIEGKLALQKVVDRSAGHAAGTGAKWRQTAAAGTSKGKRSASSAGHVYFSDSDESSGDDNEDAEDDEAPHVEQQGPTGQAKKGLPPSVHEEQQAQGTEEAARGHAAGPGTQENGGTTKHTAADLTTTIVDVPQDAGVLTEMTGNLAQGDVIAYKILEIASDWTPQVSEYRYGSVSSLDDSLVTLDPWPPGTSPTGQAKTSGEDGGPNTGQEDGEEEEEEEEGPPSQYDEQGVLCVKRTELLEVRMVKAAAQQHASTSDGTQVDGTAHSVQRPAAQPGASAADGELTGPAYSRLGPPAPSPTALAATHTSGAAPGLGRVVPSIGAWAEIAEQLQRRREQLKRGPVQTAPPEGGPEDVYRGVSGVNTPGAVRPRGGVRRAAIGPFLKALRDASST